MERFKSKFNGLVFIKDDNGRCYQMGNAMRAGEEISKKVKRRISSKDYAVAKQVHKQMLAEEL